MYCHETHVYAISRGSLLSHKGPNKGENERTQIEKNEKELNPVVSLQKHSSASLSARRTIHGGRERHHIVRRSGSGERRY
jgi:hypothetical protein